MVVELAAFRERWDALLDDPQRDDIAAQLVAPFDRDLDEAREAILSDVPAVRAAAIGRLFRGALVLELVRRRKRFVVEDWPYARELRARVLGASEDSDDDDDDDEREEPPWRALPDPTDPFIAWTLGELAEGAPEPERASLVRRAIDAFDAIALSPISPGNDLGPFTQMAHLMNADEVRRALTVTERMAGADWSFTGDYGSHEDLSRARQYLVARLAGLGLLDEAESLLPTITDGASRAEALGRMRGHRIVQGSSWQSPLCEPLFQDGKRFLDLLRGLTRVLELPAHPPPEALLADCIAHVHAEPDEETRTSAVILMEDWFPAGSPERWFSAICASIPATDWLHVDALFRLSVVAQTSPVGPRVVQTAIARMLARVEGDHVRWLDGIYAVRDVLPFREVLALFATALITTARASRALLLQELHVIHDLEALLSWLGGEPSLGATAEAIDEVERLLR